LQVILLLNLLHFKCDNFLESHRTKQHILKNIKNQIFSPFDFKKASCVGSRPRKLHTKS